MNRMLPSMKVAQFIDHEHRCWRDNLIRLFFPDECSRHILSIHLPRGQCEDKLIWQPVKSGKYYVKSGYKQALLCYCPSYGQQNRDQMVWEKLWKLWFPPKWALFIWTCLHRLLPLQRELKKRGIVVGTKCVRCHKTDETIEHLFFHAISHSGFGEVLVWVWTSVLEFQSPFSGGSQHGLSKSKTQIIVQSVALLWAIWLQRNSYVFNSTPSNIEDTIKDARNLSAWAISFRTNDC